MRALSATLADPADRPALVFGERTLSFVDLRDAAGAVALELQGVKRVAVWAQPRPETVVAVIGALAAGAAVVPVNPKAATR